MGKRRDQEEIRGEAPQTEGTLGVLFSCLFDNHQRHAISLGMYQSYYYAREKLLRLVFYNGEVLCHDDVSLGERNKAENQLVENFKQRQIDKEQAKK